MKWVGSYDGQFADLYVAEFIGGPLDGWIEIREGPIPRRVTRRWYGFNPKAVERQVTVFEYELVEPVEGGWIEYSLCDPPPTE